MCIYLPLQPSSASEHIQLLHLLHKHRHKGGNTCPWAPPQLVGRTRSLSWATWLWRQTLTQGASQALPNKYCRLDKIGTSKDARSLRKLFFPWTGSTSSNHAFNFSMLFKFSLTATSTYITLRGGLDYLWRMRGKKHYFALQWKKAWAPGTDQLIRFKTLSKVSPYFPTYTLCCIYNIYTICIHYVFKINTNKQYPFRQSIYAIYFPYKQCIYIIESRWASISWESLWGLNMLIRVKY